MSICHLSSRPHLSALRTLGKAILYREPKAFNRHMQAEAAAAQDRTIIIINPLLKDVPSSSGVMGVRCVSLTPVHDATRTLQWVDRYFIEIGA